MVNEPLFQTECIPFWTQWSQLLLPRDSTHQCLSGVKRLLATSVPPSGWKLTLSPKRSQHQFWQWLSIGCSSHTLKVSISGTFLGGELLLTLKIHPQISRLSFRIISLINLRFREDMHKDMNMSRIGWEAFISFTVCLCRYSGNF